MARTVPVRIDRQAVFDLMKRGIPAVDVLGEKEYQKSHIAGAINIPLKKIDRSTADRLAWDEPVIVYCHDCT